MLDGSMSSLTAMTILPQFDCSVAAPCRPRQTSVRAVPCETEFEALVREHRLLVEHKPPFNRVGVRPERNVWLRLTSESFPRLSIVRERNLDRGSLHLGPFASKADAELARDGIASVIPIRTCQETLSVRTPRSACALADMQRCSAPCDHRISAAHYREIVETHVNEHPKAPEEITW